jgi:hypothetical protein
MRLNSCKELSMLHQKRASYYSYLYFSFWWYWGLTQGLVLAIQALYNLSHAAVLLPLLFYR